MQTLLYLHNKMIQCCILITESVRAITDVVDDCVKSGKLAMAKAESTHFLCKGKFHSKADLRFFGADVKNKILVKCSYVTLK